jgi:hypothetical protein
MHHKLTKVKEIMDDQLKKMLGNIQGGSFNKGEVDGLMKEMLGFLEGLTSQMRGVSSATDKEELMSKLKDLYQKMSVANKQLAEKFTSPDGPFAAAQNNPNFPKEQWASILEWQKRLMDSGEKMTKAFGAPNLNEKKIEIDEPKKTHPLPPAQWIKS